MNTLISFNLCTLTDKELVVKVDKMTDDMYRIYKIHPQHIPARPNDDYDLLVGELCRRFNNLIKEAIKI